MISKISQLQIGLQNVALFFCLFALPVVFDHASFANAEGTAADQQPQLVVDADGFTGVRITHLRISSDGKFLAAAAGKVVRVWNLNTGKLWTTLRGYQERQGYHIGYIDSMSFSPDGRFLTVGVSDNVKVGSTREYDLLNPTEIHRLIPGQGGCTRQVAYSPDGKFIATYG